MQAVGRISFSFQNKEKNDNYSNEKDYEIQKKIAMEIINIIEEYDVNFKNRIMQDGWDVGLNTDWSEPEEYLWINIYPKRINLKEYYNQ